MPELILLAGPNGAGKTSFANELLSPERDALVFVNADEIARSLRAAQAPLSEPALDMRAARVMLREIGRLTELRCEFMIETTLSTLTYAARISHWKRVGYEVHLIYLRLPSAEASIERVRLRVEAGGHDIPEATIRRRFQRSLHNLETIYKPIVDEWYIWDSLDGDFKLAESWDG